MSKTSHLKRELTEEDFKRLKKVCKSNGFKNIPNLENVIKEACEGKTVEAVVGLILACLCMIEPWEALGVIGAAESAIHYTLEEKQEP